MITIANESAYKLVKIYLYVCEKYDETLKYDCQRFSNNSIAQFTDQEVLTIYLFVMNRYGITKQKDIYNFAKDNLRSWFPDLGSYQAFNNRINFLSECMNSLLTHILTEFAPSECSEIQSVVDSMPIITCSGKRKGKVATEVTAKGYCSTKSMYYYGLKLHALGFCNKNKLPHPESFVISSAAVNDITIFKEHWSQIQNRFFFADKIYQSATMQDYMKEVHNSEILSPIKTKKGLDKALKKRDEAYNRLYSKAVSTIRQPIEALFSWIIQKTDIQNASKVRSIKGLNLHVFGRMAAAFISLIF